MAMDLNQLMALLDDQKQKQTALERVAATQVTNQPIMNPGQTRADLMFGRNSTPEQKRGVNAFLGSILNRDPGKQTAIGAATDGFERGSQLMDEIRTKAKAEKLYSADTALKGAQNQFAGAADIYGAQQVDAKNAISDERNAISAGRNSLTAGRPTVFSADGKTYLHYPDGRIVNAGATEGTMGREADLQKEARKKQEEQAANMVAAQAGKASIQEIGGLIKDIRDGTSYWTSGTAGAVGEAVPFLETDAKNRKSLITTLQSKMALDKLMAMKEASKTGASGFGALSAPELDLLLGHIALLDQATDAATQLRALEVIDQYYGKAMADFSNVMAAAGNKSAVTPVTEAPPITQQQGLSTPAGPQIVPGGSYTYDPNTGTFK